MRQIVTKDYAVTEEEFGRIEPKIQWDPNGGCWLWQGAAQRDYAVLAVTRPGTSSRQTNLFVHRLTYARHCRALESHEVIDHKCRVTLCVNPAHLRPVTNVQNVMENSLAVPAQNALKTHCKRGHSFDAENTYSGRDKLGRKQRICRACKRDYARGFYRRRAAAKKGVSMNKYQCGPFGIPQGQVTVEVPDGVTKTFAGGEVRNSLTNADFAVGGPDGGGYGAFPAAEDSNVTSVARGPDTSRFRVG